MQHMLFPQAPSGPQVPGILVLSGACVPWRDTCESFTPRPPAADRRRAGFELFPPPLRFGRTRFLPEMRGVGLMKIVDVLANNLTIPYPGEVRPAWQPGLVVTSHNFTLVRIRTDQGITGYGGTSGHLAGVIAAQLTPYLVGEDP